MNKSCRNILNWVKLIKRDVGLYKDPYELKLNHNSVGDDSISCPYPFIIYTCTLSIRIIPCIDCICFE